MKLTELWHTLRARLGWLLGRALGRRQFERDLDDEMAFHLEMLAEKETAAGATPREAGYAAQRRFGNATHIRENCRDAWTFAWLEGLFIDMKQVLRFGVMPAGFALPAWSGYVGISNRADFWLPLNPDKDMNGRFMGAFARMKPGVTPSQVASEFSALSANIDESTRAAVLPMAAIYDSAKFTLTLLFVITALVWLLATANVANMALARATARVRESGLRAALGAGTWRIARQFILENMTLTAGAGILSLLLAHVIITILRYLQPSQFLRLEELRLNWTILGFTLLLALLTALATGFLPALQVARMEIMDMLGASGARSGDRPLERRSREALIVLQVALALIMLVGTGLLARSLFALSAIDPGIDARNVLTFKVKTPEAWPMDKQEGFFTQLLQSIDALPGVESVAYTVGAPPLEGTSSLNAKMGNSRTAPDQMLPIATRWVSHDYFRTFGIPLLQGQDFSEQPAIGAVTVMIVSETLARRHWPGENLVGKELIFTFPGGKQLVRIAGVAKDVKDNGIRNPGNLLEVYGLLPGNPQEMVIGVRTNGSPMGYAASVRQAVREVNPDVAPYKFRTMEQVVGQALGSDRFLTGFLGVFAAIALCLALIGIYGVVSYVVGRRAKEIGIRMALGATPWRIYRTLGRRYLVVTVVGLASGLGAIRLLTGLIRGLLYQVTPYDAGTLAGASLLLLLTALLAVWLPVRQVIVADPMCALNSD